MFKEFLSRVLFGSKPQPERVEPEVEVYDAEPEDEPGTGNLTIRAMSYDDETGQIKIDMDWDEEFVNYLKRNGFTGATEESIVHKYVATMYQNMVSRQQQEGREYE